MSGIGTSIETESRLVIAQGWGSWEAGGGWEMIAKGCEVSF